jgi:hypothetical protein
MGDVVLYIGSDRLQKSWRDSLHPRDTYGKFTAIKGGSKVVTSTGKAGVVQETGDTHHKVRFEDGRVGKVKRENVLHANDHAKVVEAKKKADAKAKRAANAAAKGKATKEANKTNATGGTGRGQNLTDPTVSTASGKTASDTRKPSKSTATASTAIDNIVQASEGRKSKRTQALEAPVLKRDTTHDESSKTKEVKGTIPQNRKRQQEDPKANEQSKAADELNKLESTPSAEATHIDAMWNTPKVQAIMALPVNKRNAEDIKNVAGAITQANDKLARHVVKKMAESRGLHVMGQMHILKRHKGANRSAEGKKEAAKDANVQQEQGVYGDLLQAARGSMYETLHSVLSGSQNPEQGTSIAAHTISRMKQKLHRDIYDFMNDIPAPHEIRGAIGDMRKHEESLTQKLGRAPTHGELADHLEANSKAFKDAPIVRAPHYDDAKGDWVQTNKRYEDPSDKLRALKNYSAQQKTTSIDKAAAESADGKTVSIKDSVTERTGASPEEAAIEKERQAELKGALPQAMRDMGLTDDEIRAMTIKHSQASETGSKASMTASEVAQRLNDKHGADVDTKWVENTLGRAMKKISAAVMQNHPAIQQLRMLKSLVVGSIMKAFYEYDLVKSLRSWGVGVDVLQQTYTRTLYADSKDDLLKSMEPHEYVGSFIMLDEGDVVAHITELTLPPDNDLYKSFNAHRNELRKSMFPHKGGSNHAVNSRATEYVKANKKKYGSISEQQHAAARSKGGGKTWSEELLLKNPGSAWITWGGKRVLVSSTTGELLYDSSNAAHRDEHNAGAQEDKLEFHHEREALASHEEGREASAREGWKSHIAAKEKNAGKKDGTFDYATERASYAKKNRGVDFDDAGDIQFTRDADVNEDNRHVVDHGVQAFREQMERMRSDWKQKDGNRLVGGHVKDFLDNHSHKALDVYSDLPDAEREELDSMTEDEKRTHLGSHFLNKPGVKEALQAYHDTYKSGKNPSEAEAKAREVLAGIGSVAGRNKDKMGSFLKDVASMNPAADGNMEALAESFGVKEMGRAREEAGKNLLPEGKYMIGNPITGKTMLVEIGGDFTGGAGSRKKDADGNEERGKYTSAVTEAFDPDGGAHEDLTNWGHLGRALGYTGKDASNLKATLTQFANTDADKPFMKKITDDEWAKHRANTKAGLQDTMLHKEFKLVDQARDSDGSIKMQTFAQKMADGTVNHISTDAEGYIKDPLMARLLNQRKPISNESDLNELLKSAVGNRRWITAHFGSDIHIGDALGHHIQLEYDGKGAPRVVGGKYDGYRYIDSRDVPKGSIDPTTGEPVKALFKNGKLVDRRFTTQNDVAMKAGNAVMYKDGAGYRKGRIHSIEGDTYKVTDGKGHVIGMFGKGELKAAREEGRILSDSGNAVVKVAKSGAHRMNIAEAFKGEDPKSQRRADLAKDLFTQALQKANVNQGAFDKDGNLQKDIELSDQQHKRLAKVLGRSKAGKELMAKFSSSYVKELEVHVPDSMRKHVESAGVRVLNDGTARISTAMFEKLREDLGKDSRGISLTHEASEYLKDHFARKDRKPESVPELRDQFQPSTVKTSNPEFDKHYKAQFNEHSYLMNPSQGLYGTQLEGAAHLRKRGRAIAGHGMGTGKTILGVVAGLHYKAEELAAGRKPKKTLIVSPKGIMSDWGKEVGSHTNSTALFIGSGLKGVKNERGRSMWGQAGNEQEAVDFKSFKKNTSAHASEDHDFHIVNYDTFMRNREHFANSGMYDNIVIDEVHAFKNQKGKRGTALAETTDKFKNVWGLSGTPMENDAREAYALIDTVTGGKHELGSMKEFTDNYMQKDKNGKIVGIKPAMSEKLGDIMASVIQFRGGEDVTYNDGSKIHFPHLEGASEVDKPSPKTDFMGNMVDRSRDHNTNNYYGTKHSITDFESEQKEVTNAKNGEKYTVTTTTPKNVSPSVQRMYDKYKELEAKYLPESKKAELATAAATGIDQGKKDGGNYLTAMQKLAKFLNAPLSHKMFVGGGDALDSGATDAQSAAATSEAGKKAAQGLKEGEHYVVDKDGFKRYYESDGEGGYAKNGDGSPKLLPPLHKENPKAQYLQDRIHKYLDGLQAENKDRIKRGQVPMVPKVVVKSSYTTFGTDIIDNVLKEVRKSHPIFADLHKQGYKDLGQGQFTGEATDREDTKVGFRGNKHDYAKNQGSLWATTVSPAGKEGVDFGNAHIMFHYDQDWNPQKMAQFTARVRRSDSAKTHAQIGRANSVRVESMHVPNTVEDFMFNAQDAKIKGVEDLTGSTRSAEKNPKLGETQGTIGRGHRGFTSRNDQRRKPRGVTAAPRKPKVAERVGTKLPKLPAASADKALKLVILL